MYGQPQGLGYPQPGQPGYYPPQQPPFPQGYPQQVYPPQQGFPQQHGFPPQQQPHFPPPHQGYPQQSFPPQQQGGFPTQPFPPHQHVPVSPPHNNPNVSVVVTVTTTGNFHPGQEYTIKFSNNHYMTAANNGGFSLEATRPGEWEKFRFNSEGNGSWSLRTHHGKFASFNHSRHCFEARDQVGESERFEFRDASNGAFHMYSPAQKAFIQFDRSGTARAVADTRHASTVHIETAVAQPLAFQHGQEYNIKFSNNHFFTAEPNGTFNLEAVRAGEWEKFRFNHEGNGCWSLRTHHNKVVCFDPTKSCFEPRDMVGDWERFEFKDAGRGGFHMYCPSHKAFIQFERNSTARIVPDERNATTLQIIPATTQPSLFQSGSEYNIKVSFNHYLTAEPNGTFKTNSMRASEMERFRLTSEGNGSWSLRTAHGKVVCYDQGKNSFDVRDAVGDWEKFEFRDAGRNTYHMYCPAQRIFFQFDNNNVIRAVQDEKHASAISIVAASASSPTHHAFISQRAQPIQGQMRQGVYNIRNHHGRFLEVTRDRLNQTILAGQNDRFSVEGLPGNNFAIRMPSQNNRVLCVGSTGQIEYRDAIGAWETFDIRSVPGHPHRFNIYCPAQRKFFRCDNHPFQAVSVADSPGEWEQFEFIPVQ